ncbi:phosphatidylcholine synthase [Rhodobacterales bacterium HKCCE2091]|nr:phosphatidylcholine synthase [Rhodobacterales bacterium HKCCE2091]
MSPRRAALAVHVFTATGAGLAMLAFLAVVAGDWAMMAIWLAAAFVVDGIDGPLARHYEVREQFPEIDGIILDLVIDFLTYVVIPVYAIFASGLLPGWAGFAVLIAVPIASAIYFADTRMKTEDKSFCGFPGCWNMAAVSLLVLTPPWIVTLALIVVLAVAMFLPVKFIHPVRTARWRPLTLAIAALWTGGIVWAAASDFASNPALTLMVGASSLYLLTAGAIQQLLD